MQESIKVPEDTTLFLEYLEKQKALEYLGGNAPKNRANIRYYRYQTRTGLYKYLPDTGSLISRLFPTSHGKNTLWCHLCQEYVRDLRDAHHQSLSQAT